MLSPLLSVASLPILSVAGSLSLTLMPVTLGRLSTQASSVGPNIGWNWMAAPHQSRSTLLFDGNLDENLGPISASRSWILGLMNGGWEGNGRSAPRGSLSATGREVLAKMLRACKPPCWAGSLLRSRLLSHPSLFTSYWTEFTCHYFDK